MSDSLARVAPTSAASVAGATSAAPAQAPSRPDYWTRLRLRLLHRLLTPGWLQPTPAGRLRGWARVLAWCAADTWERRLLLLKRGVWTPVRAWKEAGHAVAEFGDEVAAVSGIRPTAQRRQVWRLSTFHGLHPTAYAELELYRPERARRAAEYVQEREHTPVLRWIHRQQEKDADARIFRDKTGFSEWCVAHGFPSVPTLLAFDEGELVAATLVGDPVVSLPDGDLFSKPNDGTAGHGAARWRFGRGPDGSALWQGSDGGWRTAAALLEEIAELSRTLPLKEGRTSRRMLLQPCLQNHRDVRDLTSGALCTVRMLAYRTPGGRARVVRATYRMATGTSSADNYSAGGIIAPVDVTTGLVGAAMRRRGHVVVPVARHPDTGAVIAGRRLPFWSETVALAERALEGAPRLPTIGWDMAITDDGPVIVEGNIAPNPRIVQMATGLPLSETPVLAAIDARMRELLGLQPPIARGRG